jgi:hypothetical protein
MPAALLEASDSISVEDLLRIVGPTATEWSDFDDEDEDIEAEASSWPGKDGEDEDDVPEIITITPEGSTWPLEEEEDDEVVIVTSSRWGFEGEPEEGSDTAIAS